MTTILAVYENGVLRPTTPLPLAEGQTVEVTVVPSPAAGVPTPSDDDVSQRLREAKTFQEWFEATKLLPPDDDGHDIIRAIEENRRWSAGLPPDEPEGTRP